MPIFACDLSCGNRHFFISNLINKERMMTMNNELFNLLCEALAILDDVRNEIGDGAAKQDLEALWSSLEHFVQVQVGQ
jgi:hypothetical protein